MEFDVTALAERMGESHLAARMRMQATHSADAFGGGVTFFHIENMPRLHKFIKWTCKCTGLYQLGYRNFRNLRVVHNTVEIDGLSAALDGFRLVHLSDLHLDLDPSYTDVIVDRLRDCEYDVCVMTGDYRNHTYGTYEKVVTQFQKPIIENVPEDRLTVRVRKPPIVDSAKVLAGIGFDDSWVEVTSKP